MLRRFAKHRLSDPDSDPPLLVDWLKRVRPPAAHRIGPRGFARRHAGTADRPHGVPMLVVRTRRRTGRQNSPSLAVLRPAVWVRCLQEEEKKSAKAAKALNLAMVPAPIVPQPLPPAAPMGGQMQMQQPMQPAPQQPQQQQPQTPAGVTAAGPIQAGSWQPCYDQALDPAEPSGTGAHLLPDCVCARALRPPRKLLFAFVRAFVRLLHARMNDRAPVCACARARVHARARL